MQINLKDLTKAIEEQTSLITRKSRSAEAAWVGRSLSLIQLDKKKAVIA